MKTILSLLVCLILPACSHAIARQKPSFYDRAMAEISTPDLKYPSAHTAAEGVLINLAADIPGPHNRRPSFTDDHRSPDKAAVGLGLIIAGSICFAGGVFLVNYGNNYSNPHNTGDGTGVALFLLGLILGAGGLGMLIPGIVLRTKYRH